MLIEGLEERHNILTCNNNALMVLFEMYLLTQKIQVRFNRLDARILKFQEELIEQATSLSDALGDSPNFVQAVLKVKNYQGKQLMHMILDSKVYTYMEERVIE